MKPELSSQPEDLLFHKVADLLEQARSQVAQTVNTAMVQAYWLIGREIVEVEQSGQTRAQYGEEILKKLASRLQSTFGRGFSLGNLKRMKQFYLAFPNGSTLHQVPAPIGPTLLSQSPPEPPPIGSTLLSQSPPEPPPIGSTLLSQSPPEDQPLVKARFSGALSWSHYLVLLRVANDQARAFYEIEAIRECWSIRQLERQIGSLLFERLAKDRSPEQILALARRGQEVTSPTDVLKNPFVLEFLDIAELPMLRESDVEQAVINRLEAFLLEMGKGFCFVGRQKRLTVGNDHFYVDLVFYNRLLRCFVLVDLKLGKLTHQDLGQMQMYVNYFDRTQRAQHEAKTIGIVLCTDRNAAMVKITLPEDNDQIVASAYRLYLPTEAELLAELEREREEAGPSLRPEGGLQSTDEGRL